jgi:hypothetical protein
MNELIRSSEFLLSALMLFGVVGLIGLYYYLKPDHEGNKVLFNQHRPPLQTELVFTLDPKWSGFSSLRAIAACFSLIIMFSIIAYLMSRRFGTGSSLPILYTGMVVAIGLVMLINHMRKNYEHLTHTLQGRHVLLSSEGISFNPLLAVNGYLTLLRSREKLKPIQRYWNDITEWRIHNGQWQGKDHAPAQYIIICVNHPQLHILRKPFAKAEEEFLRHIVAQIPEKVRRF